MSVIEVGQHLVKLYREGKNLGIFPASERGPNISDPVRHPGSEGLVVGPGSGSRW